MNTNKRKLILPLDLTPYWGGYIRDKVERMMGKLEERDELKVPICVHHSRSFNSL